MRNAPLHESHLLEAVRRKILSSDQMEQVLALARSTPIAGAVADVRWATVVQGIIAGAAVLGTGLGILIDTSDNGASLGTTAYSAAGLAAFLVLARFLGRFSWGRVPGSILRAGVSVCAFGVVIGLLSLVMPLQRFDLVAYPSAYSTGYEAFRFQLNLAYALASGVSALVAIGLWHLRRCAPALGLAGAHAFMAVLMLAIHPLGPVSTSADQLALLVLLLGGAVFTVAAVRDRLPRGPVDGTFWLYPVAMFPMGCAALMRLDRHEGEVFAWLPLALGLGLAAYARGRRLPLIFSAMAAVIFPMFALSEAHASSGLIIGALVASAAFLAVMVQVVRARDLRSGVSAADAPSIWG